ARDVSRRCDADRNGRERGPAEPVEHAARAPCVEWVCSRRLSQVQKPIEGVPTSITAMLGETERGAVKPRLVASYDEYVRWFGSAFDESKFLPYAVRGFFENGGKRLFICRIVGARATTAHAAFGDYKVCAVGPGAWGRRVWARIDDSTSAKADGSPIGF